ncbi:aspartyl-phosphate phosphatase Spo0E family protein [Bacillus siamensis]|uniref:aspartyl-phosphate phosphatase Spo0E family protein n=1 Tax=Bacillus siamensis TaxID=659243 RepID=UPI000648CBD2|nr:aspartyl-phosphate phosphatase Spo0E family protein [Bacillus siamensis]
MNRKIEEKRLTLFETAQKFGINATETIRCSQELDSLLNGCRGGLIQQTKDGGMNPAAQIQPDYTAGKKQVFS